MNALLQQKLQQRLLYVQPVFRLIPDDGLWSVNHFGRNFLSPMRGQAMHKNRIGSGLSHDPFIHLEPGKCLFANLLFLFLTHGCPHIRGDKIGAACCPNRQIKQVNLSPQGPGRL